MNPLGLMAAHLDAKMDANSELYTFQYVMCMCADDVKQKPDHCSDQQVARPFLQGWTQASIYATSNWCFSFFKVSLLSGRNYNTRPQKRPIQPRVTERAGASSDSCRDKSSLYHSVTQPQIPGQINKMALIHQKQFIKGIFPYVQEKLTHTSVYKFILS